MGLGASSQPLARQAMNTRILRPIIGRQYNGGRSTPSLMPKVFALVLAAGQGTRIGDAVPKQYLPIAGKPMMFHSIEALAAVSRIECVCVVLSPLDRHWGEHDWSALPDKIEPLFAGGALRSETVMNALKHLGDR